MDLIPPKEFVSQNPGLFPSLQSFYEAVRRQNFTPVVRLGKKIFVDRRRFEEWRVNGGTPLQRAA